MKKRDYDKFERLNDTITLQILGSDEERLKASKQVLERIERRKLYKYVGHTVLPSSFDKPACKMAQKEVKALF